jgi:hypothetical protein
MFKQHNGRVRITNKTNYNTLELRKYFTIVADIVGVEKTGYLIYVNRVKTRRQRVLGKGWIGARCIKLYLQKDKQDIPTLMAIIEHELYHNLGNMHKDMICNHYINIKKWEQSYSGFISEEVKTKKVINVKQLRYERVLMNLTNYSAKLRRIERLVKKYESKKKYYDKILNTTQSN